MREGLNLDPDKPVNLSASFEDVRGKRVTWKTAKAVDHDGQIDLGRIFTHDDDRSAFGYAEVPSPVERKAQMVVGSDDTLTIWLNGKQVYDFASRRGFSPDAGRFDVTLNSGTNRILIRCGNRGGPWQFSVAITGVGDYAFLKGPGGDSFDPEAYRKLRSRARGEQAGVSSYSAI